MTRSAAGQLEPVTPCHDGVPVPRLLTAKLIRQFYVPIGERLLWKWVSEGKFPQPELRHGPKLVVWFRETVEKWYQAYVEEHRSAS